MEEMALLKFVLTLVTITYSVIFGIVAKKVWEVPKLVSQKLEEHSKILHKKFYQLDNAATMAEARLNVHDRISSKISGHDFDSRAIAESGIYPELRKRPQ